MAVSFLGAGYHPFCLGLKGKRGNHPLVGGVRFSRKRNMFGFQGKPPGRGGPAPLSLQKNARRKEEEKKHSFTRERYGEQQLGAPHIPPPFTPPPPRPSLPHPFTPPPPRFPPRLVPFGQQLLRQGAEGLAVPAAAHRDQQRAHRGANERVARPNSVGRRPPGPKDLEMSQGPKRVGKKKKKKSRETEKGPYPKQCVQFLGF